MSMLTPRGESYRRRHGPSPAKVLSIGLVALVVVGVGLFFLFASSGGGNPTPVAAQGCQTAQPLKTSDVHVQIVNSTRTEGLAHATAQQFSIRGFKVVSVGNVGGAKSAPPTAAPTTMVFFGPDGQQQANLVVANLKHAKTSQDSRAGADVEVILGKDYNGLLSQPEVLANLAKNPPPKPTC